MEDSNYFWNRENTWLKLFEQEDAELIWESCGDTETRRAVDHGVSLPAVPEDVLAEAQEYLENYDESDEIRFIVQDEDGNPVGHATISWIDERNGNCDISLVILEDYRGLGHGTNAMQMLLEYCFNERRLHKVHVSCVSNNPGGLAFLGALGFKCEAIRRDMFCTHGGYADGYFFGMREEEFRTQAERDQEEALWPANADAFNADLRMEISEGVYMPMISQELVERLAVQLANIENRHFFWYDDGVMLREMTEDDLQESRVMIMNSEDCRLYDNDVKLPDQSKEALEVGSDMLRFGGDGDRIEFAIENDEGEYVGNINLCGLNMKQRRFSASYIILPEFRGQGYAAKSMQMLLEYCFLELNLHKLIMVVNADNEASNRVLRRLGLNLEGVREDAVFYKGSYISENFYGITREEFILNR